MILTLERALLKGHRQPQEDLCVGAYGDAEKVRRWHSGAVASVGGCLPVARPQCRPPLRAIGDAAHAEGFSKAVENVAAADLHLRELGNAGRAGVLIWPEKRKDRKVRDTGVIRIRIKSGSTAGRITKPRLLPTLGGR